MRTTNRKRLDIQGLRAICVFSVVAYHLDIGFFSGYLGVDLFFVISGFVISSLLSDQFSSHKTRGLLEFYQGRIFRLVPALGTLIFTVSVLSFFFISPLGMQQNAAKTGIGASLFSSNFVISKVTEDYFALPAKTNPLLHTWSLGVEEQFYLFFPVVLFVILKFFKKRIVIWWAIGFVFFILSLLVYLGFLEDHQYIAKSYIEGFYSPLSRGWQFLIGGFAFYIADYRKRRNLTNIRSSNSIFILSALLVCLNLPESVFRFPSPTVVYPILLLFFLLSFGESESSTYGKFVGARPFVWVGDRSYTIYLWHWPFIVFGIYLFPQNKLIQLAIFFLGFLCSLVAYRFIEYPFHRVRDRNPKRLALVLFVFLFIPLASAGALGYVSSQVFFPKYESGKIPGNFPGDVGAINFDRFNQLNQLACLGGLNGKSQKLLDCPIDVLLIGDSHAEHLLPGFNKNFPELNFTSRSNSFLSDADSSFDENKFQEVANHPTIKLVVFNSFWAKNGLPDGLVKSVVELQKSGKGVLILDDIPNFPFDAFSCKYGLSTFINTSRCSMPASYFFEQQQEYLPQLKNLSSNASTYEVFSTSKYFCNLSSCSMLVNNSLMYLDLNHLNVNGSVFLSRKIVENSQLFCKSFPDKFSKPCK
jgi:peptidoglycan/LPS O-acetylase OafA/YrhL